MERWHFIRWCDKTDLQHYQIEDDMLLKKIKNNSDILLTIKKFNNFLMIY